MDSLREKYTHLRKLVLPFLVLVPLILSCSSNKPPDELFHDNIKKMVLLDRAMEFNEEVTKINIVNTTVYEDQVEVEVRIEGWATHRDIALGATLPVTKVKQPSWAIWKFFCVKTGDTWIIKEKFKVAEGFGEQ